MGGQVGLGMMIMPKGVNDGILESRCDFWIKGFWSSQYAIQLGGVATGLPSTVAEILFQLWTTSNYLRIKNYKKKNRKNRNKNAWKNEKSTSKTGWVVRNFKHEVWPAKAVWASSQENVVKRLRRIVGGTMDW